MRPFRPFKSISSKGTGLVMGLLTAFSLALGYFSYKATAGGIEAEALGNLSALATAKQHAIESQVARYFEILRASSSQGLAEEVEELMAAQGSERARLQEVLELRLRRQLQISELLTCAQILSGAMWPQRRSGSFRKR